MTATIGWDIGGVHLKAARAENGRIVAAIQIPSPLRFGLERLTQAFAQAKTAIGAADRHVVTMTGELADTFNSRAEGVSCLAALAAREQVAAPALLIVGEVTALAAAVARAPLAEYAPLAPADCATIGAVA